MTIKNITSEIPVEKTLMEIEQILVKFGAKGIYKEYLGNQVKSLMFYIERENQKIPFKLPMNLEKARKCIEKEAKEGRISKKFLQEPFRTDKAQIVGWRLIKDWIFSNLSLMEIEFADPIEIFLPYAYDMVSEKNMYQKFMENKNNFIALEEPKK